MWDWFIEFLAQCIAFFQGFVGDWGLAIILLTIIVRLLLLPLTIKQLESSAEMQALQPILNELREKYADDPQRMNEEMMKFYSEHKFNPLAGCLPMLIQMPIFFALFSVLRYHLPSEARFYDILGSLASSPADILGSQGFVACIPYLIFVILFALLTFLPMFLMQKDQANSQMTNTMAIVMSVMMLFVGWTSPAGVLLFWVVSSAWAVVQQQLIMKRKTTQITEQRQAAIANKPVEVDVVRRERKARPRKKS